jgi:hypothetical protein
MKTLILILITILLASCLNTTDSVEDDQFHDVIIMKKEYFTYRRRYSDLLDTTYILHLYDITSNKSRSFKVIGDTYNQVQEKDTIQFVICKQ